MLGLLEELCEEARRQSAELLLLPELFLSGYVFSSSSSTGGGGGIAARAVAKTGPEIRAVQEAARRFQVALVLGYAELLDGEAEEDAEAYRVADGRILSYWPMRNLYKV